MAGKKKIRGDIHGCGSISFSPTVYAQNCTSTTNAQCSCGKDFLCSNKDCTKCEKSKCPAGEEMEWTGRRVSLRSRGNMPLQMKDIDIMFQYLDIYILSVFIYT